MAVTKRLYPGRRSRESGQGSRDGSSTGNRLSEIQGRDGRLRPLYRDLSTELALGHFRGRSARSATFQTELAAALGSESERARSMKADRIRVSTRGWRGEKARERGRVREQFFSLPWEHCLAQWTSTTANPNGSRTRLEENEPQ
jgi:hypothetical protein